MNLWVFMGIFMDMNLPESQDIMLTSAILNLIAEIEEFKGRWSSTRLLRPGRLADLKKVATIESVGSSTRIEGVKLTNSEVEALLLGIKSHSFRSRDEEEVAGYAECMETVFSSFQEIALTENYIKQLHAVLLKHSLKDAKHRGHYKKFPNNVEAFDHDGKSIGIVFETISPFLTPGRMKDLILWTNTHLSDKDLHPLLVIAVFVVTFLQIHPFQAGNGRLSRALTTLLLLKTGYSYVPYSSLERVIEENKGGYYLALRRAQQSFETDRSGLEEWLVYFLRSMQKQKAALERKLEMELEITQLPPLSMKMIELIQIRGPMAVLEFTALTGANRNTIKLHLKNLARGSHIEAVGVGRGIRYRMARS